MKKSKIKVATRSVDGEDSYPDYYGGMAQQRNAQVVIYRIFKMY